MLRNILALLLIVGFIYNVLDIKKNFLSHRVDRLQQIEYVLNQ
jgi:hypothetical protein